MTSDLYLGYRNDDANTPFGKFFKPEMASLPQHVVDALHHGPQGGMALLAFDDAASVADEGYQQTENGYGILENGGFQVSVRTDMPGVTPRDVVVVVRLARVRHPPLQAVASASAPFRRVEGR